MNTTNITNLTNLIPPLAGLQSQPVDLTLVYILIGLHVVITITIIILTELVKYHVINPQQTNQIIESLKVILNDIPLSIVDIGSV